MNRIVIALAGAALVALSVGAVSAQYPPPQGQVAITVSDPTPGVGETVSLTIVVTPAAAANLDSSGDDAILASYPRAPGEAGDSLLQQAPPFSCTAGVTGGSGATVTPTSFNTDSSGAAALSVFTGSVPAVLTVSVECGVASGQAILTVGDGVAQQPTAPSGDGDGTPGVPSTGGTPGTPSTGATPGAPSTGSGSESGDTSLVLPLAGIGIVLAAGAAFMVMRGRGNRSA